jgi:formylglycine-generating enzyme required for sulfatase activity
MQLTYLEIACQPFLSYLEVLSLVLLVACSVYGIRHVLRSRDTRQIRIRLATESTGQIILVAFGLVLVTVAGSGAWIWWHDWLGKGDVSWAAQAGQTEGEVKTNPNDRLKYVWIPSGTFVMGCSPGDNECKDDERPPHQVTITRGFWLGQTEVTVAAYKRFVKATGRQMPREPIVHGMIPLNPEWRNESMPIVNVNWSDAHNYCMWAGGRIPSEAEWEYAARAGGTDVRDGSVDDIAWYLNNSESQIHPVGQKRANAFGLYDMFGNVSEWVNDWYDAAYYKSSPAQDPTGPTSGMAGILRGGSWYEGPEAARASWRSWTPRGAGTWANGFRCAGGVSPNVLAGQVANEGVLPPGFPNSLPPVTPPASGSTPILATSADTELDRQVHWGMSKEQVKKIEDTPESTALIEPNKVGDDYLIYRNDSAHFSSRKCYYFTEGKLVEIREDDEDGNLPSDYDDRVGTFSKKLGQPTSQEVDLSSVTVRNAEKFQPIKSITFTSPTSVIVVVSYKDESGEPSYSVISLDKSQPLLVAR